MRVLSVLSMLPFTLSISGFGVAALRTPTQHSSAFTTVDRGIIPRTTASRACLDALGLDSPHSS